MKNLFYLVTTCSLLAAATQVLPAQTATPLTITAGYNWDLVANGAGSAAGSVTGEFDSIGNIFYDSTYLSNHPGHVGGSLATGSTVTGNSGNQYALASAIGNNVLFLSSNILTGTLDLSSPSPLGVIHILGTSSEGSTLVAYTLNFLGGGTNSGQFTFADWNDPGQTGEITGRGRVNLGNSYDIQGNIYSLYDHSIIIPEADQGLTLQSITFLFCGLNSRAAIFAVSGEALPVPEPGSAALLIAGLTAAALKIRRKR